MNAIEISGINTFYGKSHILHDVSLTAAEGSITTLLGRNGAGKTTTLRSIMGLTPARTGHIKVFGHDSTRMAPFRVARLGVGYVPEGRRVFPYMSVRDNLMMGAFSRSDAAGVRASLDSVLDRFPRLKERLTQTAGTMSGGEQQMLVIGRALMADPKLLLLDEPSLGVAPKIVQDIARSIVAINRDEKVSVLLVEQNSRMALRISHRAYALTTGSIALAGASADLVKDQRIQHLYLGGDI